MRFLTRARRKGDVLFRSFFLEVSSGIPGKGKETPEDSMVLSTLGSTSNIAASSVRECDTAGAGPGDAVLRVGLLAMCLVLSVFKKTISNEA